MPIEKQFNLADTMRIFNRAASSYDDAAVLARAVADRMLDRLTLIRINPLSVLDLGCGTGYVSRLLKQRFPQAKIIYLDVANNMLVKAKKKAGWWRKADLICAAAEQLPLQANTIDLVFSNQVFAWCNDFLTVAKEIKRVLKPGGLIMFSSLGPDTLQELRSAWKTVDHFQHVHHFVDMHDIGDILLHAKLADPVMDMEYFTLTYRSVKQLMAELKATGSNNIGLAANPALTGKHKFKQMQTAYENFKTSNSLIPATFEIVYGHAWQPVNLDKKQIANQEIVIPILPKNPNLTK